MTLPWSSVWGWQPRQISRQFKPHYHITLEVTQFHQTFFWYTLFTSLILFGYNYCTVLVFAPFAHFTSWFCTEEQCERKAGPQTRQKPPSGLGQPLLLWSSDSYVLLFPVPHYSSFCSCAFPLGYGRFAESSTASDAWMCARWRVKREWNASSRTNQT